MHPEPRPREIEIELQPALGELARELRRMAISDGLSVGQDRGFWAENPVMAEVAYRHQQVLAGPRAALNRAPGPIQPVQMQNSIERLNGEMLESERGLDILLPMKGVDKFEELELKHVGQELLLHVTQKGRDPFVFQLPLPGTIDPEELRAAFGQGELHIHLPWRGPREDGSRAPESPDS